MVGTSNAVKFPVANLGGDLIWAVDAAAASERPTGMTCVGCDDDLLLRAGAKNRPHFAHKSGASCGAGETALHRTAIRVLVEGISAAARDGRPFPLEVACDPCQAVKVGNLALRPDCELVVDQVLEDSIRPDVLIRSADGVPRTVIEVIVSHAPDELALAVYERLRLPVVLVWPTWDSLEELRGGLVDRSRRRARNTDGLFDVVNYPCRLPRHSHTPVPSSCPECSGETIHLCVEVATSRCWKCRVPVSILDLIEHRRGRLRMVAAGCADLTGVPEVAEALGVDLRVGVSKRAGGPYLANHCNRGHLLGDNFVYAGEGDVDVTAVVQHVVVCADGHWSNVGEPRRWPVGTRASRVRPAVGQVGNPAGLFSDDSQGDGGLVTMRMVDKSNIKAIARRMTFGSGGW